MIAAAPRPTLPTPYQSATRAAARWCAAARWLTPGVVARTMCRVRGEIAMSTRLQRARRAAMVPIAALAIHASSGGLTAAQTGGQAAPQGRGGQAQAPQTPQAQALIDLTGWWVSVVTEDWRWRMVTPAKGDYASVPVNNEGRRLADTWDPAKDEREGNACRSYGAAAIMRVPGRLHVTWQDENTLRIDTDAGTQTRMLHFAEPQAPGADSPWQGYSSATWELLGGVRGAGGGAAAGGGGGGRGANAG